MMKNLKKKKIGDTYSVKAINSLKKNEIVKWSIFFTGNFENYFNSLSK